MAVNRFGGQIQKSLYGRRLGLDDNDMITGTKGLRLATEYSTASAALDTAGLSVLFGSTAVWTLGPPPAIGAVKTIVNASTLSTATMSVVRSDSAAFYGSTANGGAVGVRLNLLNSGSAVQLVGVSSAAWAPLSMASSLFMTVSTSS